MTKHITTTSAIACTTLAVALAIASAPVRAATPHSQALLAGLSVAVVLAVHLAPALLRSVPRAVLWPMWTLCLAAALWAHASFLISTSSAAASAAAAASPATAARSAERAAIEQALSEIKVRPAATIARQLSWTTDPARAQALQVELQEARRADDLRQQLIVLAGAATSAASVPSADPVSRIVADTLGVSADAVQLAGSLTLALLLEVLGMLLWREVLAGKKDAPPDAPTAAPNAQAAVQAGMQQIVQFNVHPHAPAAAHHVHEVASAPVQTVEQQTAPLLSDAVSNDLQKLRTAISRGECKPTLSGIRQHMRCGQQRAIDLRAALLAQ